MFVFISFISYYVDSKSYVYILCYLFYIRFGSLLYSLLPFSVSSETVCVGCIFFNLIASFILVEFGQQESQPRDQWVGKTERLTLFHPHIPQNWSRISSSLVARPSLTFIAFLELRWLFSLSLSLSLSIHPVLSDISILSVLCPLTQPIQNIWNEFYFSARPWNGIVFGIRRGPRKERKLSKWD